MVIGHFIVIWIFVITNRIEKIFIIHKHIYLKQDTNLFLKNKKYRFYSIKCKIVYVVIIYSKNQGNFYRYNNQYDYILYCSHINIQMH